MALSTGLLLAFLLSVYFLNQEPRYEATASIVVEVNSERIVNMQEVIESGLQNSSFFSSVMNTHIARLKSRTMAEIVTGTFTENQKKRFLKPHIQDDSSFPSLSEFLNEETLQINWRTDSQIIQITAIHSDAHVAKIIADKYANNYIKTQFKLREDSTDQAVIFLDEQTIELRRRLEAEENALQDYRMENDLVTVEQNQAIITARLGDLNSVITKARVRLLEVDARLAQLMRADGQLHLLMNIPFIGGSNNIERIYNDLQNLKTEERVLRETFLERHPKVIENVTKQKATEESLWISIRQNINEVEVERQTVEDEIKRLEKKLDEAEKEARRLENLSIEYRVLARKVDAQKEIYERITSRLNETSIAQKMDITTMRILDLASTPSRPNWPDPKKIGLIAVLLFGACFLGLPLAIEFFDNRLRTFSDIEGYVGKSIIGDIPEISGVDDMSEARINGDDRVELTEAFRNIYGYVRITLRKLEFPRGLVITSSVPAEGKTFIINSLGSIFSAHKHKTLLVDFDLRRPSLHKYHSLNNKDGIIKWIQSEAAISEDILDDANLGISRIESCDDLYVLSSGGSTTKASEILSHARMDILVSRLRQEFDIILFDTPPIGIFQDAAIASDYADHTIFVARQNQTTRQKTRHSVSLMDRGAAPILGVIFNGVKNRREAAGYGSYTDKDTPYGSKYMHGYGRDKKYYKQYYSKGS